MSFIFEKSRIWRRIVTITKHSPGYMAVFGVMCFVVPYYLGDLVMRGTNGPMNDPNQETQLEKKLRAQQNIHHQAMARANKERLAVLLGEIQRKEDSGRYKAALNGESLGAHSTGTSAGVLSGLKAAPSVSQSER